MKYFLRILVGLAMPLAVKAEPADKVIISADRSANWLVHTEVVGQGDKQATYYYTNIVLTGSHLPAVIRRYKGHLQIVSGAPVNGRAFSSSVASTFTGLDPALAP